MGTRSTNIKDFQDFLQKGQFYDIGSGEIRVLSKETNPSPKSGQAYEGGQQGNKTDCASHAVGGCVVEIINGFKLNCDQEKITDDLRQAVQPNAEPKWISEFNLVSLKVEVKDIATGERHSEEIGIIVQPADSCGDRGITPKMTEDDMNLYKWTKMIAVQKGNDLSHAMYVKSYMDSCFVCVDSRPDQTTKQLERSNISEFFYVSITSSRFIHELKEKVAKDLKDERDFNKKQNESCNFQNDYCRKQGKETNDGTDSLVTFVSYLMRKTFFDVVNQKVRVLSDETEPHPPVGQPAVPE